MINDGFVLPDREMVFDKRFDLNGCLLAFHSFLRNYSVGGKPFDLFLKEMCIAHNVNMRLILPFLQMGHGMLSRKQEPGQVRMTVPERWGNDRRPFGIQLAESIKAFRTSYDTADLEEPFQLKDTVLLPKSRVSFALISYIGEAGQQAYPDSGLWLYVRCFNQLGRFVRYYGANG